MRSRNWATNCNNGTDYIINQKCNFVFFLFCPNFFTGAILPRSGFNLMSWYLLRFQLSQCILIHCSRWKFKVNNRFFSFIKTTSTYLQYSVNTFQSRFLAKWLRPKIRRHKHQRYRYRVGHLVDYVFWEYGIKETKLYQNSINNITWFDERIYHEL